MSRAFSCAAVFAGVLVAACSDASDRESPPSADASAQARIEAVEAALASPVALAGEERPRWTLAERMEYHRVPGVSIAVFADGEPGWAKGYGVRDAASGLAVDIETLFQAASLSKPVAAIGALRLVERGDLALDAPVNAGMTSWQIPANEFTAGMPVTLRHLLAHGGGLTMSAVPNFSQNAALPTAVELLEGRAPAANPPVVVDVRPGEAFRYSGGGYTVLQQLIADVTGQDFSMALADLVLTPAGMTRSVFEQPLSAESRANAASAHGPDSTPIPGGARVYPALAAGGLWTTPGDMIALAKAIVRARAGADGALLNSDTAAEMLTPQFGDWGLGPEITTYGDGVMFGHGGTNAGFRNYWFAYADGRGGAAIMTNSDSAGPLVDELAIAICSTYGWSCGAGVERVAVALSPEMHAALAGEYIAETPVGPAPVFVTAEPDGLFLAAPPFQPKERLYAASETELFLLSGQVIDVVTDADGRPSRLELPVAGLSATRTEGFAPD